MVRRKQGIEEPLWPRDALPFQHPKLVATPPSGPDWLHEVKFDGWRMQVHVREGRARLFTRRGLDYTDQLPNLAALAGELPNCVLDAELCYLDESGYSNFSGLKARLTPSRDGELTLMAFDILWRDETDQRPYALERRKQALEKVLAEADHVAEYIRPVLPVGAGGGQQLLAAACRLGWEGIVSKRLDSAYKGGERRPDTWLKSKCRQTETVVIGGWVSRGGLSFSHLLAGVRTPEGQLRYVGSVKGGFKSEPDLPRRLRALAADRSPFDLNSPRKTIEIHWVRPELAAEIEMAEYTASGNLRQATFKGLRDDLA